MATEKLESFNFRLCHILPTGWSTDNVKIKQIYSFIGFALTILSLQCPLFQAQIRILFTDLVTKIKTPHVMIIELSFLISRELYSVYIILGT